MKKIIYLLISVIALNIENTIAQTPRLIHFVHGFGANASAWQPVTRATEEGAGIDFPARNVIARSITYTPADNNASIKTIADAGASLRQVINDQLNIFVGGTGTDRAKSSFIIAHSQGGLVSRWAADISIPSATGTNALPHFGGIVTFGSPHNGARIASSRFNGDLDVFLNQGCKDLGGAILGDVGTEIVYNISNDAFRTIAEFLNVPALINNKVETVQSRLCNAVFSTQADGKPNSNEFTGKRVLGAVLGGASNVANDPLLYDYQDEVKRAIDNTREEKDIKLDRLKATPVQPNIVRVAFYGKEINSQAFIRTLQYMVTPSQTLSPFAATDDKEENGAITEFTDLRNTLENTAIAKENEANSIQIPSFAYCLTGIPGSVFFWVCIAEREYKFKQVNTLRDEAAKLRKGYQWLDNSNAQWLGVIGARTYNVTTSGRCYCTFSPTPIFPPNQATCLSIGGCYRWETITTTTVTDEDNDGVVTKSSALAMPGAIPLTDADAQMNGSQHMQMRNDPRTKEKLIKLYSGSINSFFQIN